MDDTKTKLGAILEECSRGQLTLKLEPIEQAYGSDRLGWRVAASYGQVPACSLIVRGNEPDDVLRCIAACLPPHMHGAIVDRMKKAEAPAPAPAPLSLLDRVAELERKMDDRVLELADMSERIDRLEPNGTES